MKEDWHRTGVWISNSSGEEYHEEFYHIDSFRSLRKEDDQVFLVNWSRSDRFRIDSEIYLFKDEDSSEDILSLINLLEKDKYTVCDICSGEGSVERPIFTPTGSVSATPDSITERCDICEGTGSTISEDWD